MIRPETVFINARVITMDPSLPRAEAVAVSGGKITAVGDTASIRTAAGPGSQVVDLGGQALLPGFIDTHVHFVSTGIRIRYMIDLTRARSIGDIMDLLTQSAHARKPGEWILAAGFDHSALAERRYPSREELDRVAPDHPVCLRRRDGHSCLLNSTGLAAIDIPPDTPGFRVGPDGEPTGVLQARANALAGQALMRMFEDVGMGREACLAAAREAAAVGITTIHALTAGNPLDAEGRAMAAGDLPVRLIEYFQTTDVAAVVAAGLPRIGGCILVDGSVGSQTAALAEPYADDPATRGTLYFEQDQLSDFVISAHTAGLQVAVHAIGDRAIEQAVTAFEHASAKSSTAGRRHRIEHFMLPTDDQMVRARNLDITPAMQPAFEHFWGGPDGLYAARLGDRVRRTNPLRRLLDLGLVIGGGSDSLVTPMNPLLGIDSAVNHSFPEHRVSVMEALQMFTVSAAYQAFEEDSKGSIRPGNLADLVVLGADPTAVCPQEIASVPVVATITGGHVVHGEL